MEPMQKLVPVAIRASATRTHSISDNKLSLKVPFPSYVGTAHQIVPFVPPLVGRNTPYEKSQDTTHNGTGWAKAWVLAGVAKREKDRNASQMSRPLVNVVPKAPAPVISAEKTDYLTTQLDGLSKFAKLWVIEELAKGAEKAERERALELENATIFFNNIANSRQLGQLSTTIQTTAAAGATVLSDQVSQLAGSGQLGAKQLLQTIPLPSLGLLSDNLKFTPTDNDGLIQRFRKHGFNLGVDALVYSASAIQPYAAEFAGGVQDKVIPAVTSRLDPNHLATIVNNPELSQQYVKQRTAQLMQIVDLFHDPVAFGQKKLQQANNTLSNACTLVRQLDGVTHGINTLVDLTQEQVAETVGVGISTFAVFNLPSVRMSTDLAFRAMFPSGTLLGTTARFLPAKFLLTKHLARLAGNPVIATGMIAYFAATAMGKSIQDSVELKEKSPDTYERLAENKTELIKASKQMDARASIEATRKPRN